MLTTLVCNSSSVAVKSAEYDAAVGSTCVSICRCLSSAQERGQSRPKSSAWPRIVSPCSLHGMLTASDAAVHFWNRAYLESPRGTSVLVSSSWATSSILA